MSVLDATPTQPENRGIKCWNWDPVQNAGVLGGGTTGRTYAQVLGQGVAFQKVRVSAFDS